MNLKLSQKHSNKADGIHYLVSNMLQLHISQTKFCFLEQQTLCVYEISRSAWIVFYLQFAYMGISNAKERKS